ncbi:MULTISPECIES: class I SAM-dependent methyltransferase [unclassified Streptomyces]|uniref:class I SAM-dependent methyltransferase n=1 Tax=unclassified Streptomyces TaxID=2593676 RepID=UPI00278C2DFA|nr:MULTISPECIES: class I SAM-dependent methyltransferase [unclassified Streptomyces]
MTSTSGTSTGSLTRGQLSPLDQLRLFERKYDPTTRSVIDSLSPRPTWRCLELGAGAGSMARWLAERATSGSVLAVDTDPRHLTGSDAPNLTVREADITEAEFGDAAYDLVLARAVLEHLDRPQEMLDRAVRWLAPGGRLVVQDFYYLPSEHAASPVTRALVAGYVRRMQEQGADLSWGRHLPAALGRAGLTGIGSSVTPAGPGQSPADDELIGTRMRQEGHTLVNSGLVTREELTVFLDALGTPQGRDMTTLLVSAWGRRPEES